jgi:hypothetical protein
MAVGGGVVTVVSEEKPPSAKEGTEEAVWGSNADGCESSALVRGQVRRNNLADEHRGRCYQDRVRVSGEAGDHRSGDEAPVRLNRALWGPSDRSCRRSCEDHRGMDLRMIFCVEKISSRTGLTRGGTRYIKEICGPPNCPFTQLYHP